MGFDMLKSRLVTIGYPAAIKEFEYDPTFPCRGLWFDKQFGNLLKVDAYYNILVCIHGFKFLKGHEVSRLYPNKYLQLDDNRVYVLNTLFNLPETYMIACMIDYFTSCKDYIKSSDGVKCNDLFMSFRSIFQDVRASVDWIHEQGTLKQETVNNPEKFVHKDKRLPLLLKRLREHGAKTMLITNSDYTYSNKIMEYLLDFPDMPNRDWTSYFDIVVVSAKKPLFFKEGTILRKVDRETGTLSLGHHLGPLRKTLDSWNILPLEFDKEFVDLVSQCDKWADCQPSGTYPAMFRCTLSITDTPRDTFLCTKGWGKGIVFMNGFHLGRYWRIGPQQTMYVPAPLLRQGNNQILIFEQEAPGTTIEFLDTPILDEIDQSTAGADDTKVTYPQSVDD